MFKFLINNNAQGPWGGYFGDKGNNPKHEGSKQEEPKRQQPSGGDGFDDFIKKINNSFKKFLGNDGTKSPKSLIGIIVLTLVLLWLASGFYKVDSDENAVVLYFGKFNSVTTPGLNYHVPFPFGKVLKESVTIVNTEEFGFTSAGSKSSGKRNLDAESLMLTGDENIVDIEFQVQWQISDIKDFVFNTVAPRESIRKAAESAMREIIARTPIVAALSDGKSKIELESKELLQQILDSYKSGVRIVLVQLRRVDPPAQVIDAFRDVQTAKADKEKEINQAQAYANDVVPRARGTASQMIEESEAFAKEVVTNAEGEAGRFIQVYNQYALAKQVTRKRIYLETMEKILGATDKVIIDNNAVKSGVAPYYPLNEVRNKTVKKEN